MNISPTILANYPQTRLRSLRRQAVRSGDVDLISSTDRFLVGRHHQPCWHNISATRITKKEYRRIFTMGAWVHYVWNKGDHIAKKYMDIARPNINDPRFCVRVIHEVQDLELRRRWMSARYEGGKLPRVTPEVKRLFEKEFKQTYPGGVRDIESDNRKPTNTKGLFPQKWGGSRVAWKRGFLP